MLRVAALLGLGAVSAFQRYDDFHYPVEEPKEMSSLVVPEVLAASASSCTLRCNGQDFKVAVGDVVCGWRMLALMDSTKVAAEYSFPRWGVLGILSAKKSPLLLRKSVGALSGIKQPFFNFSASDPAYFNNVRSSLADLPASIAKNLSTDGDPDFPSLASVLAPARDITEISGAMDAVKFVVSHTGRVKCASDHDGVANGITEYDDLHAAPPNQQTVIFDPADHIAYWPSHFEDSKSGLVGGHLRVANVGSFSRSVQSGFEVVAFAPVNKSQSALVSQACIFDGPHDGYLPDCSQSCQAHKALDDAEAACGAAADCYGITMHQDKYELRAGKATAPSPFGETSWLLQNAEACRAPSPEPSPRRPGINYQPGVYVQLHEERNGSRQMDRYFYVTNTSNNSVTPEEFFSQLVEYVEFYDSALEQGMHVELPDGDRRQRDMAFSALLATWGNYLGDQSNYGDGATYWSIGRQDNGSLPLNILSVEEANLEWGLCHLALPHIGFYFDNYVREDGSINYYTWGSLGDSVGDTGRLASLYVKAQQLCPDEAWERRYQPTAELFGLLMLKLRAQAVAENSTRTSVTRGLVVGVPEHDWSGTKDKFFYSNNVWLLRGMEELGVLLKAGGNVSLGETLLKDVAGFREDLRSSLAATTVLDASGQPFFSPPWAEASMKPFKSMTAGHTESYSNFRFYSEELLADVLPRDLENVLLTWHNERGGRLGGASRFDNRLDDMPTAGWGYGALTNNRTEDFLALLYGHMATYQSRGSFHSTEQLAFTGEGWYRDFAWWPNSPSEADLSSAVGYYRNENDISFCIVSEILMARLTRWQLVFEDFYRPAPEQGLIWLARAAPKRWFASGAGFRVKNAPTRFGRLSFNVSVSEEGAAYSVMVPGSSERTLNLALRWPYNIEQVRCDGCTVAQVESHGSVRVAAAGGSTFRVTADKGSLVLV